MSDGNSENGKDKGFDISKFGGEMSDEERTAADQQLTKQFRELAKGRAIMQDALRDIGGASAMQQAITSVDSLQSAIKASGIISIQDQVRDAMSSLETCDIHDHFSTLTGAGALDQFNSQRKAMEEIRKAALVRLPENHLENLVNAQGAASRLMDEMRENHRLFFQHADMFADIRRSIEAINSYDLNRAIKVPQMNGFFEKLGIARIGSALAAADAARVLGFQSAFNDDIHSVTSQLNEQLAALRVTQEAATAALRLGVAERLEEMLARSIAAQETLVDEYREAAKDAKAEAAFHRRNATINTIINLLMFLLYVAMLIEGRMTDNDEAFRANTEAVRELQQSFDGMASQMERMRVKAESASAAEQAADAAIAELLREMADSLAEQSDVERKEARAEAPTKD